MYIPHCPNPPCVNFHHPPGGSWCQRYGHHYTDAFGTVQRFTCTASTTTRKRMAVYRFSHHCLIPRRVHESMRGINQTHAERAGFPPEKLST
jgi:hypothetical protein